MLNPDNTLCNGNNSVTYMYLFIFIVKFFTCINMRDSVLQAMQKAFSVLHVDKTINNYYNNC